MGNLVMQIDDGINRTPNHHCDCGHHWSGHDQYGCDRWKCECKMIDKRHEYRDGQKVEVPVAEVAEMEEVGNGN